MAQICCKSPARLCDGCMDCQPWQGNVGDNAWDWCEDEPIEEDDELSCWPEEEGWQD